jgi:methylenetetrahydrofolate reductase (NADPH)
VAQYAKFSRKVAAGAQFVITQLGFDARKFAELIGIQRHMGINIPALGSVYVLTPGAARIMNQNRVPGAVVTDALLEAVQQEWQDKAQGRQAAIERAARLGAVLKGLGYRGIHIGGIHRDFETAGMILDRMETIGDNWQRFIPEFDHPQPGGFYAFPGPLPIADNATPVFGQQPEPVPVVDRVLYPLMRHTHNLFFNFDSPMAPVFRTVCRAMDSNRAGRFFMHLAEHPLKRTLLGCQQCGDCAIQHVGFLCPESGCPKHTRNGACGGSLHGMCEVNPDRRCVWFRAHTRLAALEMAASLCQGCVPPRMWELNNTSSRLNFHLRRDHQSNGGEISGVCRQTTCRFLVE